MTTHLRTKRTPRRWPILGNVLATLSLLIGAAAAVELLYALLFSGGYEAIPEGAEQLAVWFALPTLALTAAALAMRQAIRVADHGGRLLWIAVADGAAVVTIVG